MSKFQYKFYFQDFFNEPDWKNMEDQLNKLGLEGWEAVSTMVIVNYVCCLLKKEGK